MTGRLARYAVGIFPGLGLLGCLAVAIALAPKHVETGQAAQALPALRAHVAGLRPGAGSPALGGWPLRCLEDDPCWNPCMSASATIGIHSGYMDAVDHKPYVGELDRFEYDSNGQRYACVLRVVEGRP